jgi:hypothetical protein
VAVVVANVYDDIHYLIHTFPRQHFDLGGIWRSVIWPDHELRLRVAIVVALFVLPWCAAAWLGYLHSEDENEPRAGTISWWNRFGLAVLSTVLLANVFASWMVDILGW